MNIIHTIAEQGYVVDYLNTSFPAERIADKDVAHSYIIELKHLKADATDAQASQQWDEAVEQIRRYAQDKVVKQLLDGTRLHLLVVQIKGYERLKAEEIAVQTATSATPAIG